MLVVRVMLYSSYYICHCYANGWQSTVINAVVGWDVVKLDVCYSMYSEYRSWQLLEFCQSI